MNLLQFSNTKYTYSLYEYRMDLSLERANKAKSTFSKILFERVFEDVVVLLNRNITNSAQLRSKMKIYMLDIAGFGRLIN